MTLGMITALIMGTIVAVITESFYNATVVYFLAIAAYALFDMHRMVKNIMEDCHAFRYKSHK